MSLLLPKLRVGEPVRHENLSVFPLFAETCGKVAYRLSDEALSDQSVLVEEISQSGCVPNLLVENKGDVRVLFLEGEELIGAKQNRILNTSVLVPAHTKLTIPVSCVEQGRWRYKSRYFGVSGSHSPSKLRRALRSSVSRSVQANLGHTSDQMEIWKGVSALHARHQVASATGAMSDAFETYKVRIAAFTNNLKYIEGASGLAVAIGGQMISFDLFDKASTCRKIWDRLLSGVVFDALESGATDQHASVTAVEQLLGLANTLAWKPTVVLGDGKEFRAESPRGDYASALVLEGAIVHGSVVAAV
jgi:hypothetical protein